MDGQRIGPYQVLRTLGRGGMATVYLARDERHHRSVALKVLHPELATVLGPERFLREIEVAANLSHPNILPLFDSGTDSGLLYYVMPFVDGESLRDRLRREGQLPVDDALRIAREVADALVYAHDQGVIHRDIKPENILLTGGHARLADFGIARAVGHGGGEPLTSTGMAVGTAAYMSPEQASGGHELDGRTDVYSLGCVLYEMLAGEPPHTGPSVQAIIARALTEPARSIHTIRPAVSPALDTAIAKAVAITRADRYTGARDFVLGLDRAQQLATGQQPAAEAPPRSPPRLRRRLRLLSRAVAAGVLAAAGAIYTWRRAHPAPDGPLPDGGLERTHVAVLYFADDSPKHELEYLADGLTEGLIRTLGAVNGLSVVSQGGVARYRAGTVARDSIARALAVGTLVAGSVEPEQDSIRVTVRLLDDAGIELDRATFKKPARDLIALSESLSEEVALLIRRRLGSAIAWSRTREGTSSTEAWARYQRGILVRGKGDSLFKAGDTAAAARAYRTADSLASLAERLDPRWPDPSVLRGMIAYRRSRQTATPRLAATLIDSGLVHAGRAMGKHPKNPDALELRGTLHYWRWLLNLEPDSAQQGTLLAGAQADLEESTRVNPGQAGAYATLSHLYNNVPDKTLVDVAFAANKALEKDAYLDNADVIVSRLIYASYDGGQFAEADKWCREGRRRFPEDPRFVECAVFLMLTDLVVPDPALAWTLVDSVARLTRDPEARRYAELNGRLLAAGVLARAGQRDSARRVLSPVRPDPAIDATADLEFLAAYVWTLVGDDTKALDRLKAYLAVNPGRRAEFRDHPSWWFRRLSEDPRYRELVGVPR